MTPTTASAPPTCEARFWAKVPVRPETPESCWEWTGTRSRGYGRVTVNGERFMAHRRSYEMAFGPIPLGLEVDHLCHNRRCVRPSHLEAVTPAVNKQRAGARIPRATHCINGHEYSPENTYWSKPRPPRRYTPFRQCRTCHRITERNRQRRAKAVAA